MKNLTSLASLSTKNMTVSLTDPKSSTFFNVIASDSYGFFFSPRLTVIFFSDFGFFFFSQFTIPIDNGDSVKNAEADSQRTL